MQRRTFISAAMGSLLTGTIGWQATANAGNVSGNVFIPAGPDPVAPQGGRLQRQRDVMRVDARNYHKYTGSDLAFGTTLSITVMHHDQKQAELAIEDGFAQAKKVDALMSIYSASSQVYQLNRAGTLADPDPHLLTVLAESQRMSRLSQGAFDITVQPLWLQFTRSKAAGKLPAEAEIMRAKALVNWRDLEVSPQQLRLNKPGMSITLNGIAQGYAVDLALAAVRQRGIVDALLDTGEFISVGRKSAVQPWLVGVQNPRNSAELTTALQMDGRSVATSGDYATTFSPDFMHHHIFDPATGDSPLELASVTVAAPTGLEADALSTALFVMGHQQAIRLASQLHHVDVLIVSKQGSIWTSPGLKLG